MSAQLHPFPERVTMPIAELARLVAIAQENGYRNGLADSGVASRELNRLSELYASTGPVRADVIIAHVRRWLVQAR